MSDLNPLFQQAAQQYGLDPDLLKAMGMTESDLNPAAISPKGATGVMQLMPGTAADMGVKDPLDPAANINGGAQYIKQLIDQHGDLDKALSAYNWGPGNYAKYQSGQITQMPAETSNYIKKVAAKFQQLKNGANPMAATAQAPVDDSDPIMAALAGKQAASAAGTPAGAPPIADPTGASDPIMDALSGKAPGKSYTYSEGGEPDPNATRIEVAGTADQPPAEKRSVLGDIGHQLGLTARAGVSGVMGLPNMFGDALNSAINLGTMGVNYVAGTDIPQLQLPSQATQELMDKAGVSKPENELEGRVLAGATMLAGVPVSGGMGQLFQKTSSPMLGAIGTQLQQMPGMQGLSAVGGGMAGQAALDHGAGPMGQLGATLLGGGTAALAGSGATRLVAASSAPTAEALMAQALKDRAANAQIDVKPRFKLNLDGTQTPIAPPPESVLPQQFSAPPAAPIPNAGVPRTQMPTQQQLSNIETLNKIGLNEQRPSAITGDKYQAGIDYENAKLLNPLGQTVRDQLAKEQATIKNFGQGIIEETGAKGGTPEATGQAIRAPMQGLSKYYDNKIGDLYQSADQAAKGAPIVQLNDFGKLLSTDSVFAGKAENSALRRGIRAYTKEQGIVTAGQLQPIDVQKAEGLRQYLNSQWSPQNSGLIGKIKESLDGDVTKAAGGDVYAQARALHAERKNTLDNPNGIGKLLTTDGPNGINQAIPDEQVTQKLLGMPTGQFKHIVDTIKNLPPELQDPGQAALAEIRASIAKRIYDAGDSGGTQNGQSIWNAAKVTKELNAQKSKLGLVFDADQLEKFKTLNDAGHILQTPIAYKGAAAQGYNFLQSGAINGLSTGGAILGSFAGGPIGAGVGSGLGKAASAGVTKAAEKSMAARYAEALRNPMPVFPPQ